MPETINRFIVIVLDSVGIGALPDAPVYGDAGSNTLVNVAHAVGGLRVPNMMRLGLGNISPIEGVEPNDRPEAAYGRMAEVSAGKDTTTGHWEIAGIVLDKPFPVYPDGFPDDLISEFEARIGRKVLGNVPASGTQIIEELGEEHISTGFPIVYTSADSVFQVAAHEDVIPPRELYRICTTARELLAGDHAVGRVIARPFAGEPGSFYRTERRKDFSLEPPEPTLLDLLSKAGFEVYGVGKIEDIFANKGLTGSIHSRTNMETMDAVVRLISERLGPGLILANCVEFDMVYGHRNDPAGYAEALRRVDARIPEVIERMDEGDVLVLTADHGCDPTTPSTDHSREYVPLLVTGEPVVAGTNLGTRSSFADLGATIAQVFGVNGLRHGESFAGIALKTSAGAYGRIH